MPPFQYTEAQSVDEAVTLLSEPGAVAIPKECERIRRHRLAVPS